MLLKTIQDGGGARDLYFAYADGLRGEESLCLRFAEPMTALTAEHAVLANIEVAMRQRLREQERAIAAGQTTTSRAHGGTAVITGVIVGGGSGPMTPPPPHPRAH